MRQKNRVQVIDVSGRLATAVEKWCEADRALEQALNARSRAERSLSRYCEEQRRAACTNKKVVHSLTLQAGKLRVRFTQRSTIRSVEDSGVMRKLLRRIFGPKVWDWVFPQSKLVIDTTSIEPAEVEKIVAQAGEENCSIVERLGFSARLFPLMSHGDEKAEAWVAAMDDNGIGLERPSFQRG